MRFEQKLKRALDSADSAKIHKVFEEVYAAYGKLVYFLVSRYVDNADAEDLTQEVFIGLFDSENLREIKNLKYYLTAAAKNKAKDFVRRKRETVPIPPDKEALTESDYSDVLNEMRRFLTEEEVEIVIGHVVDGCTFSELSKELNKPSATVATSYYRAIKKMKKRSKYYERK